MSYEVEHLTKLGALKSLAEKIKEQLGGYAKTTAIADMQTKTEAAKTYATKSELTSYAKKADIASVYKPAGSTPFDSLPETLTAADVGKVYNVTDAFTTTEKFLEGVGKAYPAGTNVVVVAVTGGEPDPDYKFDALAGMVDLTDYAKKSEVKNYTHPDGDGNLHVPATGTTNANKVLTAGSTAGSLSWGHKLEKDVPSTAVFTDTTYSKATASTDGLMPKEDKKKLDDITIASDEEVAEMLGEVFTAD